MSWMSMLYQTYENNVQMIGYEEEKVPLTPVAHMVAHVQIELTINVKGQFKMAQVVPKEESITVIPVTEQSAGRASGVAPHALCDTLSYVAGDMSQFVNQAKQKKVYEERFAQYQEALEKWAASQYCVAKVQAVLSYISQKHMIQDLIACGIVKCKEDGTLDSSKISGNIYEKSLVRFIVLNDNLIDQVWKDSELVSSYTKYYCSSQDTEVSLCYLTGEWKPISTNHPKGIIAAKYGAKLISANDKSGLTYRGRFRTGEEAVTVSYEASQKSHNALRWLASRQGEVIGRKEKRTYICWNPHGKKVPKLTGVLALDDEEIYDIDRADIRYKTKLRNTLHGYRNQLNENDDIVILGLDAATTGRLSIVYYNELKGSDYLNRIENWYTSCCWYYWEYSDGKAKQVVRTPTIERTVEYAYGTIRDKYYEVSDKIMKEQFQRLLFCMLNHQTVPYDIVLALATRASMPFDLSRERLHEQLLDTACAYIRKYYNDNEHDVNQERGEKYHMTLDTENQDRSYLFGRLLAVLEAVERSTYQGEKREPNAIRLQNAYVHRPMMTWKVIEECLNPYYQKTKYEKKYKDIIGEITDKIMENDPSILNQSLEPSYLLGYYHQRKALYTKKDESLEEGVNQSVNEA